ncbi:helix-turn-helix domain-containing protein [Lysinibacillus sp. G4S2]|uniref:helix-turn-helix domain-containing protein n=1 Tax=Lysinibacillus sp. G4S2 TaxID=3055859 RepID=UPI0025A04FE0|nr:helix-turn-helix domain-containing protein [Lysinibacillus sp. G4S2]MDM5245965.1 helix-turn-helix domain-containing protein [Lysinibacillus sp. G4S2]
MRLLLIDRDSTELSGIRWFLHTYFPGDLTIEICTTINEAPQSIREFEPEVILLNIDLLSNNPLAGLYHVLQKHTGTILAMTTEPLFKNALKAIDLQVAHLFVKPIDLEVLKQKLTAISLRAPKIEAVYQEATDESFYYQLFLDSKTSSPETTIHFTMIEPEHSEMFNKLYNWLQQTPIYYHMKIYPLSDRIVCLFQTDDLKIVEKDVRTLMKEWRLTNNSSLNIGIYDGEPATVKKMYSLTKRALHQSFYEGFGHIFYASKQFETQPLDPLLTPEEQQLLISSLEDGNIEAVKVFLYRLSNEGIYYEQDDLRIHLTSVLAQIRRFMLKYKLHEKAAIEQNYRQLFHLIIEHPIFYTILNGIISFTQRLIELAREARMEKRADYVELAIEIIDQQFQDSGLSLPFVAHKLGISPNYLSTIFSKKRGLPFKRYLQQVRIHNATKMLVETDFAISEIAYLNGFDDPNYFIKIFKQQIGLTPNRYRKT